MRQQRKEQNIEQYRQQKEELQSKRRDSIRVFYAWVGSTPIGDIINNKYKRGLAVKYQNALGMSKRNSGITQEAWLEFMKQHGVLKFIDAKVLTKIHQSQVKEIQDVDAKTLN